MSCPEYAKLSMHFCSAEFRVKRYANPDAEPRLVIPLGNELQNRLEVARKELIEFRNQLQSHLSECAECKANGTDTLPDCLSPRLR